jgi:S1-C subfamily serine protease
MLRVKRRTTYLFISATLIAVVFAVFLARRSDSAPRLLLAPPQIVIEDDQSYDDRMNLSLRDEVQRRSIFSPDDLSKSINRSPVPIASPAEPQSAAVDDGELYRRSVGATVALYTNTVKGVNDLTGSQLGVAFVVEPSGLAVTCFHAIRYDEPFVMAACTADGRKVAVKRIVGVFPRQDIALIQLDDDSFPCLPLRIDAPSGTSVRILGHPLSLHFFMIEALLARYQTLHPEGDKPARLRMDLSLQATGGFSGGPVLDHFGNVIGIQDSIRTIRRGNESFTVVSAVPSSVLYSCLRGNYHESLTQEEAKTFLHPWQPSQTVSSCAMGKVVSEVDGTAIKLSVFDAAGHLISEGAPSARFRANLPDWAKDPYEANLRAISGN